MWTQQFPPAFCVALMVQRKHQMMKKEGLTVQLFIPEFKTITWGKRLAKKVSWRVAGSRRNGGFRDSSLSPNQLNKLLCVSHWAADYRDLSWVSECSWSCACFSGPTKCSWACSHLWEGSWAGLIAAGEEGRAEQRGKPGSSATGCRWEGMKMLSQHYSLSLLLHKGDTYSSQDGISLTHPSLQIILK